MSLVRLVLVSVRTAVLASARSTEYIWGEGEGQLELGTTPALVL